METRKKIILPFCISLLFLLFLASFLAKGCFEKDITKRPHDMTSIETTGKTNMNNEDSAKKKEIMSKVKVLSDNIRTKKSLSYSREPEYKAVIEMGNAASKTLLDMLDEVKGHENEKGGPYNWLVLISLLKKIGEPRVMDYLVHLLDTEYWAVAGSGIEHFAGRKFMESKTAKPTQDEIHMANIKMKKWWKENRNRYIKEK